MTSLKVKYADETMDAMAKILDSAEFKEIYRTASLEKEAADGPLFAAFKKEVDAQVGKIDLELILSKYVQKGLEQELGDLAPARQYMAEKARGKQPGMTVPTADDTECAECLDSQSLAAVEFTLKHLVKIADALDGKGFTNLAGVIDETIEKVASKKKKKITKAAAAPLSRDQRASWDKLSVESRNRVWPDWEKSYNAGPEGRKNFEAALQYDTYDLADKIEKELFRASGEKVEKEPMPGEGAAHLRRGLDQTLRLVKFLKDKFGIETTQEKLPSALESMPIKEFIRAQKLDAQFGQLKKQFNAAAMAGSVDQLNTLIPPIIDMLSLGGAPGKAKAKGHGARPDAAFIKEVQRMLGVKVDGIWGPKTCGAWNKYVKTLEPPYSMQGCQEGGPMPEVEAIKATMQHGKKKFETAPEAKPVAPKAKPAQISDTEEPSETPRQKELRQQYEKMTGGKPISGR